MAELTDLVQAEEANPSGTGTYISVIPVGDITTFGVADPAAVALEDRNVIKTDHTIESTKKFVKIDVELDENEFKAEAVEAIAGASKKLEFTGFIPNISDAALSQLELLGYKKLIVMVHLTDGKTFQLGDEFIHARLDYSFESGKNSGGKRGFPITVTSYGRLVRYDGSVSYTPAV